MEEKSIIISQQSGVINTNFDELKENLYAQMQVYRDLEVTEENKTDRKKDIATLRKFSKALNDKKIEVKNEFMKPYTAFEGKVKELQEIYAQPITLLDNQVKEFEEKQRLEKISYIKETFNSLIGDLSEHIVIDTIYDSRWENATASKKSVKEEIESKINEINQGIAVITGMQSDKSETALQMYYDTLNLPASIAFINRYEQQKKEILAKQEEQRIKEREAELEREKQRVREEERERYRKEQELIETTKQETIAQVKAKEAEEHEAMAVQSGWQNLTKYIRYGINASEYEHEQIVMYLNSLGVTYERID